MYSQLHEIALEESAAYLTALVLECGGVRP